jgi:hypothetical protein
MSDNYGRAALEQLAEMSKLTWVTPTFVNGWSAKAGFAAPAFAKDMWGFVHFRGMLDGSAATNNTVCFVLPVGYRPALSTYSKANASGVLASVPIGSNGEVKISASTITWVSLDGVEFYAGA